MSRLIIGLGNIGENYEKTRHNLGFMVADSLALTFGHNVNEFKPHSKAKALTLDIKGPHDLILVKPTTMMNLSGQAVGELVRYYKVDLENIWLIYDDVDLKFGQLRVRLGGGSAGHNGVKSVIAHLGDGFWRARLGISNDYLRDTETDKFVLDNFSKSEQAQLPDLIDKTVDYISAALLDSKLDDHTRELI